MIVHFEEGAVVPHTGKFQARHVHLLLRNDLRDRHRREGAPRPPSRRVPGQGQSAAPGKSPIRETRRSETLENSVIHVANNAA